MSGGSHKRLSQLAQRVKADPLFAAALDGGCPGAGVTGVAVSGGADSVALLRLLLELNRLPVPPVAVVHVNHSLRGEESDGDEQFVRSLAEAHRLQFYAIRVDTRGRAQQDGKGIEAAARELRREFFLGLVRSGKLARVYTAHTRDDQAETLLLRLLRGTGPSGLQGIRRVIEAEDSSGARVSAIGRPLLGCSRQELRDYLKALGQPWREDTSNQDVANIRNRVRHQLLPMLQQQYNPELVARLADLAEIAAAENDCLAVQVQVCWRGQPARQSAEDRIPRQPPLDLPLEALAAPLGVQRRILKLAEADMGITLSLAKVDQILGLLRPPSSPQASRRRVNLGGWSVSRRGDCLRFEPSPSAGSADATRERGYSYPLPVPGEVAVSEAGVTFRLEVVEMKFACAPGTPSRCLISWEQAQAGLTVRNWRAGDSFQGAFSKGPKKVKELLQAMHLQPEAKATWPVIVCGEAIVWGRGFPLSQAARQAEGAARVVVIAEVPDAKGLGTAEAENQ